MTNYRKFGMEFECFNPLVSTGGSGRTGLSGRNIATAVNAMGYQAISVENHFNANYTVWQVKPDITVAPGKNGLEVVSRTLPGREDSLVEVTKVANWLIANGYDVDKSCGYHVHLDASDMTSYEAAAVALRYHHCQREIDTIMPPSRRGSRWAQRLAGGSLQKVVRVLDSGDRTEHWMPGERYVSVNLQHLASGRSSSRLEFRQHSGTLDAAKIVGWYKFLCGFVAETLRLLSEIGGAAVTTPLTVSSPARAFVVRQQRNVRPSRTRSVVVAHTEAPRIPVIEPGTDYDRFLMRLENNGVVTVNDAREFGWMNGTNNNTNSRLRVTAHWLRRNGAELLTTQRNGELAYVGANGATTRAQIFSAPAQIRQRVTTSAPVRAVPATSDLHVKLETTPVLSGMSEETVAWFNERKVAIGLADLRRAARVTP